MRSIWNESDRRDLFARVERIDPQTKARWGKMSAPQMLAHMADAFRMALGDINIRLVKTPLRFAPVKFFVIYVLPFIPKGAPTARELQKTEPTIWREDVLMLRKLMDRLISARSQPSREWPSHPLFGTMSAHAWGVINYKHMDHHLKQFGV